jgi:hypothetical protein
MYGWVAPWISAAVFVGLSGWAILLLVLGTHESLHVFRNLFNAMSLRQASRFRLRSLLLAAAVIQVLVATAVRCQQEGGEVSVLLYSLGCAAFFMWLVWVSFEEVFSATASRRWKRIVRADRISVPAETGLGHIERGPEPPPLPGDLLARRAAIDNQPDRKV